MKSCRNVQKKEKINTIISFIVVFKNILNKFQSNVFSAPIN